ncbi:hypothetical protein CM19_06580 [Candidatus Acidianus copahuensis]|uniref:Uncharacterized protein n=1 Tax=Candidatus Acidianus copahuensis TaxID=1160895 RepID=A0A031LPU9_9CREN|nr:hypothetical protein CM19_06580 [Candidatus Acidianus copahuensis]
MRRTRQGRALSVVTVYLKRHQMCVILFALDVVTRLIGMLTVLITWENNGKLKLNDTILSLFSIQSTKASFYEERGEGENPQRYPLLLPRREDLLLGGATCYVPRRHNRVWRGSETATRNLLLSGMHPMGS